jgi:hypothetical protein
LHARTRYRYCVPAVSPELVKLVVLGAGEATVTHGPQTPVEDSDRRATVKAVSFTLPSVQVSWMAVVDTGRAARFSGAAGGPPLVADSVSPE